MKLHEEHTRIVRALWVNNYPETFVSRVRSRRPARSTDESPTMKHVVIPYVRGLSKTVQRILSDVGIIVAFRPHTTLRQELVHLKDPVPSLKKPNVVYCIPCSMCPAVYVGQTSRPLETQLKEHKDAVKHVKTEVLAVAEHVWKGNHQVDFQRTFVLAQEPDTSQQCLLESWFIQSKRHTLNREAGSYLQFIAVFFNFCTFFIILSFVFIFLYFLFCGYICLLCTCFFLLAWFGIALTVAVLGCLSHCPTLPLLYRVSFHHYVIIPFSLFPGLPGNVFVCLLLLESWFCSVPWLLGNVFVPLGLCLVVFSC